MKRFAALFALLFMLTASPALSCSDFLISSTDGTHVVGRSMDFSSPLPADLVVRARGEKWSSPAPNGKTGMQWKQKYGFVGFSVLGMRQVADGMNEKGLAAEVLWLPSVGYQEIPASKRGKAMGSSFLPSWVLGSFASVDEVAEALPKVLVWGREVPEMQMIPTLHMAVHDASGKSLVVEWVGGKLHMYDNPLGVMTNDPPFPMQLANLRNYVNLTPWVQNRELEGIQVKGTGYGSGTLGLPGDSTGPSRFTRLAVMKSFAYQPENAEEAVTLTRHLLNAVDVLPGVARAKAPDGEHTDYTQWTTIKDLTNLKVHFNSYKDHTLRMVDLKRLDFSRTDYLPINVQTISGNGILDVTP